jgi:octaprenyl-diphosphate synthase
MTTQEKPYVQNGTVNAVIELDVIDKALAAVEDVMNDVVNSDIEVLREASWHILESGGKRVRPRLVILSFAATGGADLAEAVRPAAAVELVHTASVVHDDINDHGVMRRGRPSINKLWGRTFALLTGDFLFTKVYELMAPYKDLNITLSDATVALVEGETLQASAVKNNNLSSEVYFKIIGLKTAALFRSGASIGAQLAGATEAEVKALEVFGYNIGLAFQIVDDILDLTSDDHQLGKTSGIDIDQGKGLASVQNDPMAKVKSKLMQGDRVERGKLQARQLVESAIAELDVIPDSPYKQELIALAHNVINRSN